MVAPLGNLNTALRTAQSGLWTTQQVLDVVANNVANVNTPGYSRKEAQLDPVTLAGAGVGVQMKGLSRTVDQGLLATLRRESGALKAADIAATFEGRLQDVFGTPDSNSSIAHLLTSLQTAIQSLAASPDESLAARDAVRWAEQVGTTLNQMSGTVQGLRRDADQRLAAGIREASTLLANIADLNGRIVHDSLAGRDTTGLSDARDQAADHLAELLDVRVMTREQGDMVIFTAAGRTLVDGTAVRLSHTPAASVDALSTYAEGDFAGIFAEAAGITTDITSALGKGELGQLVALRDQTLPDVQSTLDALAATLRDTLSQVHNRGLAFPGLSQATGSRVFAQPATQTISLASGDTVIALFDASGTHRASTAVSTLMGGAGPWTISTVAAALDGWLNTNAGPQAGCGITDSRLAIDLATTTLGLAFRDQASAAPGAVREDARIAFSAVGGAGADETVAGFSSFFGLNDLFVDKAPASVRESAQALGAASLAQT
jgi:flagellar hook-associated protein 1